MRRGGSDVSSPGPRGEGEHGASRGPGKGRPAAGRAPLPAATSPDLSRAAGTGVPGHVLVGEFGRAQGLRGEVRLKSFTADPLAIASYGPFATEQGSVVEIASFRSASGDRPDMLVVRLEGVATREAAEALTRTRLYAPRERLGETGDDEFFLADLVGLRAVTPDGEPIGEVVDVPDYGGGELLEIAPAGGGPTRLAPFTRAFVPQVDIAAGRVVVDLPPETEDPDDEPRA